MPRELSDLSLVDQLGAFLCLRERRPSITLQAWFELKDYSPEDAATFRAMLDINDKSQAKWAV